MMRSLFSGVSGLRVHQTKMDVLGNNIANVNTVGYKASRITFAEVFSQNLGDASAANPSANRGGVNPMQIGLGATAASVDKLMTIGASQRTDNPFDLMIQGEGFFIVGDSSGQYFTRAGALNIDASGNLVNNTGLKVMGWDSNTEGTDVAKGVVKPIQITGSKDYIVPNLTSEIDFKGNINAVANSVDPKESSMTFYDSVGNAYVMDAQLKFVKGTDSTIDSWQYSLKSIAYPNGDRSKGMDVNIIPASGDDPIKIEFGVKQATIANDPNLDPNAVMVASLTFDVNGLPTAVVAGTAALTAAPDATIPMKLPIQFWANLGGDPEAASDLTPASTFGKPYGEDLENVILIDFTDVTQFGNETSNATATAADGNGPGRLNGMNIGTDGKIIGRYSNGQTKILGQIPVAKFTNPAGLEKVGSNLFVTTANSGDFDSVGQEVQSGGGSILGGVLEMSNVDLSAEFTEMITTQRGFQANSRVITTSDDLLQELVNLKR